VQALPDYTLPLATAQSNGLADEQNQGLAPAQNLVRVRTLSDFQRDRGACRCVRPDEYSGRGNLHGHIDGKSGAIIAAGALHLLRGEDATSPREIGCKRDANRPLDLSRLPQCKGQG